MLGLGVMELVLILILVILFFGARRIPDIARGVGSGIRNFKHTVKEPDEIEGDRDPEGDEPANRG